MYKKYEVEFSKIYKRLMALEITIKQKATEAIISYYGDDAYRQFIDFFEKKRY